MPDNTLNRDQNLHDSPDWEALARYLAGESPPEEVRLLEARFASQPADKALMDALGAVTHRMAAQVPTDLNVEQALEHVKARRVGAEVRPLKFTPRLWSNPRQIRWRALTPAIAAVAVMAIGVAGFLTLRDRPAAQGDLSSPGLVATGIGVLDSMRLPDGTRVVLGPRSSIKVAQGYGSRQREVEIQGEVYFDVVHDSSKPFITHASGATIQDIGTSFAVRTDAAEGVAVTVSAGSVALRAAGASETSGVVLKAGDRGILLPNGQAVSKHVTEDDMAWMRGQLVFREAPLSDVAASLRRWYGIELRVADSSLASRHLTATFSGEPPERVLDVIRLVLGGTIERRGDTAIVRVNKESAGASH
jgi:transmembrane sensor